MKTKHLPKQVCRKKGCKNPPHKSKIPYCKKHFIEKINEEVEEDDDRWK